MILGLKEAIESQVNWWEKSTRCQLNNKETLFYCLVLIVAKQKILQHELIPFTHSDILNKYSVTSIKIHPNTVLGVLSKALKNCLNKFCFDSSLKLSWYFIVFKSRIQFYQTHFNVCDIVIHFYILTRTWKLPQRGQNFVCFYHWF